MSLIFGCVLVFLFTIVRLVLLAMSWPLVGHGAGLLAHVFILGFLNDLAAACLLTLPYTICLLLAPRWMFRTRAGQRAVHALYFLSIFFFAFISVVEVAFFDEFNARFNYIAVDYLLFPTEVAGNIWQSYPVIKVVLGVLVVAFLIFAFTRRRLAIDVLAASSPLRRFQIFLAHLAAGLVALVLLQKLPGIEGDRLESEVAANGIHQFFYAFWTQDLNYDQFYQTLDPKEAQARAVRLLGEEEAHFLGTESNQLAREMKEDGHLHDVNLVIFIEESFGAKYTGVLGHHPENLTPRFDALAKQGLLFSNFYATGNRTARGLEAILCGFPPIPGVSILKRSDSEAVFTLADVLKSNGYETLFIYGGRGVFDNMRRFMLENGFDRFIEQKDFQNPTFTTIWGVCDEDIFNRTLAELDAFDKAGKRFFTTVLSVSNHKPYTYPAGRIDLDPERHRRENAFKYSDWALGDFFEKAKSHAFFKKTVFVVIGDHGARIYGADFFPMESYEVPFLIYAPGLVAPGEMKTLGSSFDVAPTLLGLTNMTYKSVFFGRDMFDLKEKEGYALMQHDRDVAMMRGTRLAVLSPHDAKRLFDYDRATHRFQQIRDIKTEDSDLIWDAVALYQTGYNYYKRRLYHVAHPARR